MNLSARLATIEEVTARQRETMLALMQRHYFNVRRAQFEADLAEKRWVILIHDAGGALCGFSTQTLLDAEVDGRAVKALFSGDTIIDRSHWGQQALTHVWGRLALALIDSYPGDERYWFLISKGYKTYRFLPVFFQEFYPRHDYPTPSCARSVIDALALARYARAYDSEAGVIRAGADQYRLREEVAPVTAERLHDPHVRFFQARNPGHARGDELCCLAPLSRENFTAAAYRVIGPEPAALALP